MDVAFHPFIDTFVITGDDAGVIKATKIPADGMTEDIKEAVVTLEGHAKKICLLAPHPVANNILGSISFDATVRIWDIEAQQQVSEFEVGDQGNPPLHMEWSRNGSLACVTCRDTKFRLYDPRDSKAVQTSQAFTANKKSSIYFADNHGLLVGVGSTKSAVREYRVWDQRNINEPLASADIDQANGVFIGQYDPDNSILWLAGKGDSTIKYFEVVKDKPYVHILSQFGDNNSTVGGCFLPKRYCDVTKCEIAVFLRLLKEAIVPVSFQVPRKSDLFQKDLYPDAIAGIPALEAKEWLEGKNADPKLQSMKPGVAVEKSKVEFQAKKSIPDLEAEVERLHRRISELEAQIAKKK